MRANLELARRVHEKYPHVLIEMHDMLMGGANPRNTPVYYKYGLPGSYDSNWGFELMWDCHGATSPPGRARSLYYYNLSCNVPIYLHIDLPQGHAGLRGAVVVRLDVPPPGDRRHAPRPGGGGGPEGGHAAGITNWNGSSSGASSTGSTRRSISTPCPRKTPLSSTCSICRTSKRTIGGSIDLEQMGLKGGRLESGAEDVGSLEKGVWTIHREMPALVEPGGLCAMCRP